MFALICDKIMLDQRSMTLSGFVFFMHVVLTKKKNLQYSPKKRTVGTKPHWKIILAVPIIVAILCFASGFSGFISSTILLLARYTDRKLEE